MSFQATHLQFANQVKEVFKVKDLTRYFSGTLYPDSRYITKIDRAKTHTDVRIEPAKIFDLTDDFYKGWQVHLWYDKLALKHLDQIALGREFREGDMKNPEIWIKVTAAKIVEDLYWWQNTDWPQILPYLKPVSNPNNEKMFELKNWYEHFINFYQKTPNLADYNDTTSFWGISEEKITAIPKEIAQLNNDPQKRQAIIGIFQIVEKEFLKLIK